MLNPQELHSTFVSGKRVSLWGRGKLVEKRRGENFTVKCTGCSCKELSGGADAKSVLYRESYIAVSVWGEVDK